MCLRRPFASLALKKKGKKGERGKGERRKEGNRDRGKEKKKEGRKPPHCPNGNYRNLTKAFLMHFRFWSSYG